MIYDTLAALPLWAHAGLALAGLWIITSRVNYARMEGAVRYTNSFFEYQAETSKIEAWRVLSPEDPFGDCEDNALTAIRIYSNSGLMFLWNVCNPFKFRIWHVTDPVGIPHAIAVFGKFGFDNHYKRIVPVQTYKDAGYKFRFPWPFPLILLKLAIGKVK